MRTLLVYLLALAAIAAGLVLGFPEWFRSAEAEAEAATSGRPRGAPPPVLVTSVARTTFSDTLEALGTVRANESVELTPHRSDHVVALNFEGGERVEAGQLLLELNVEEEKALLREAEAVRNERQLEHDRIKDLVSREISASGELDTAVAQLAAADARVANLEAAIEAHTLRAPFTGTLGLRRVSLGAWVQPFTVVTTLDDLSVVKLDFTIPETWLPAVAVDMRVVATSDAWPDEPFAGRIVMIDTRLDPSTRSATVRAEIPNPKTRLRPGMLMKVRVDRGEAPVVQVPEESLESVGQEHFVFVVDDGDVARRTRVEIGRRRVGFVEIVGGLDVGQRVVVEGIVRVRADAPVRVVGTRGAP